MSVPKEIEEWSQEALKYEVSENYTASSLSQIVARLSKLRASLSPLFYGHQIDPLACEQDHALIISDALSLDADLQNWVSDVPVEHHYAISYVLEVSEEVYSDHYHVYHDIWTAALWNNYRGIRMLVHEIILNQLKYLLKPYPTASNKDFYLPYLDQTHASMRIIMELVNDTFASVPFYLGYSSTHGNQGSAKPSLNAAGGSYLLWPLFIAGQINFLSEAMRVWAAGRLNMIADHMGLRQARFLAQTLMERKEVTDYFPSEDMNRTGLVEIDDFEE